MESEAHITNSLEFIIQPHNVQKENPSNSLKLKKYFLFKQAFFAYIYTYFRIIYFFYNTDRIMIICTNSAIDNNLLVNSLSEIVSYIHFEI